MEDSFLGGPWQLRVASGVSEDQHTEVYALVVLMELPVPCIHFYGFGALV